MVSLHILPPRRQPCRSTIIEHTSVPQRWSQSGIHTILLFRIKNMRSCNRWVVEVYTWRIQRMICGRDEYKSLQVSSGMRGRKFGACFNCSHYCVHCWKVSLNPDAMHRPHWYCSKVGDRIEIGMLHIWVHNSEGTSESAPSLFE